MLPRYAPAVAEARGGELGVHHIGAGVTLLLDDLSDGGALDRAVGAGEQCIAAWLHAGGTRSESEGLGLARHIFGVAVQGPFTPPPEGAAVLSPSNRRNPVVTGADGTLGWNRLSGIYKLTAVKAGCLSSDGEPSGASASFVVPPALDGLRLELDCRPRDTTPPKIRIDTRPPEEGNGSTVSLVFTVTDDQPDFAAYCLLEDEEVAPRLPQDHHSGPRRPRQHFLEAVEF